MKMIPAGTAAANQYGSYVDNCTRNAACLKSFTAPLPSVSALQLYVDFGETEPTDIEFTFIDHCNNDTEQIVPADLVISQTPEGGYYGVFRNFSIPSVSNTAFVVHLSVNDGAQTFFSQMFSTEPCGPLMKIKSCHPEGATTTGFDINGIYYGLPQPGFLGLDIRYWHIAYTRFSKVRELSNKATFTSNLYSNFRTTVEKVHLLQTELVHKWYKDVLLAIYSRGVISVDDGQVYIVSDLAFEALNDDDLLWKPYAQLKETFKGYYGCDDGVCEACCDPNLINVTMEPGEVDSEPGVSESEPTEPEGCVRVIFGISGTDGEPWAIGGLMCDGHPMSMESVVGSGITPLPMCVQFDSLFGITPPVSILFTEPCPNDCVIYRNTSLTENTTGITYRDCAGVWHEDITLAPGEEICARRSWVIGPTTGAAGPGSGVLEEIGFCGSFPDESESGGGSESGSTPGGGSEPGAECCDPTVLTAGTETTIPDGSLPGEGSESAPEETCCTPVILDACIETLDESGSGSGSESEPPPDTDGVMVLLSAGEYATKSVEDLAFWNTFYDTATNADTPFDEIILIPDELKIVLKGATNLVLQNVWAGNTGLNGFWDNSGAVIETGFGAFSGCTNLAVVELNFADQIGDNACFGCTSLTNFNADIATIFLSQVFQNCTSLANVSLPAATEIASNFFRNCSALVSINLPLVTILADLVFRNISGPGTITINTPLAAPYGLTAGDDAVFVETAGQTITLTIPTSEEFDGDIVAVQGTNTVTLILV